MSATLLCIATGQTLANLLPALQLKPTKVCILATGKMREQASLLARLLKRHDIPASIEAFADHDVASLDSEAIRIAELLDGHKVVFNATGGTKQMVLVLAETLQLLGEDLSILYADTAHQRIDWLRPKGKGSQPMDDLLSLEDILGAQGFRLGAVQSRQDAWVSAAEQRSQLTRKMGEQAERLGSLFGALNALAQRALRNEEAFEAIQYFDYPQNNNDALELLKAAEKEGLLKWLPPKTVEFTAPSAARYFGGFWLEEFVYFKLRGLRPHDYAVSVEIIAPDGKTTNEIDALLVHRNRLLAIECKTIRFGRDSGKDADLLYKLDSIGLQAGGLMHQCLLLAARPLDETSLARAKELDIEVIAGRDLRNLSERLRQWMEE